MLSSHWIMPPLSRIARSPWLLVGVALAVSSCGNPAPGGGAQGASAGAGGTGSAAAPLGEIVHPPFAVRGDCDRLLLVWFDAQGPHTAAKRADVPEPHREHVRVDSLSLSPEQRLDSAFVYLADLRRPGADGAYVVRKTAREVFEQMIDKASSRPAVAQGGGAQGGPPADGDADVIIYGADWCSACHAAAAYFRQRGIAFVEKNIERDQAAYVEMQQKARAAGVDTTGIPVIDFRGHMIAGFDQGAIERLLAQGAPPTGPGGAAPDLPSPPDEPVGQPI